MSWRVSACICTKHTCMYTDTMFSYKYYGFETNYSLMKQVKSAYLHTSQDNILCCESTKLLIVRSQLYVILCHWIYCSDLMQWYDSLSTYLYSQPSQSTEKDWGLGHLVHSIVTQNIALAAAQRKGQDVWMNMQEQSPNMGLLTTKQSFYCSDIHLYSFCLCLGNVERVFWLIYNRFNAYPNMHIEQPLRSSKYK